MNRGDVSADACGCVDYAEEGEGAVYCRQMKPFGDFLDRERQRAESPGHGIAPLLDQCSQPLPSKRLQRKVGRARWHRLLPIPEQKWNGKER
eukprot:scaffold287165_cov36-Tisochrysis_lutea.AAC.3